MRLFSTKPTFNQTPISLFYLTLLRFANHYLCNKILFADIFRIPIIDSLLLLFHCYFFFSTPLPFGTSRTQKQEAYKTYRTWLQRIKRQFNIMVIVYPYSFSFLICSFLFLLIAPRHHTMLSWLLFHKRFIWENTAVDSQILLKCFVLFVRYWLNSLFSFLYCFV